MLDLVSAAGPVARDRAPDGLAARPDEQEVEA
jgi:hypothetical protein